MNRARYSALTLAAALMLGGCASNGAPADEGNRDATQAASAEAPNVDDLMFVEMMLPHHRQALEMSRIVLAKPDLHPEVAALAERIQAAQEPEIEQMSGWLQSWGETEGGHEGHAMSGMLSAEELDRLEAADGAEASRLFLEGMIRHHQGAVEMAEEEISAGGVPEVVDLARTVAEDQRKEITEMTELLGRL